LIDDLSVVAHLPVWFTRGLQVQHLVPISKIGCWFKIPSSPRKKRGFAETGAAGPGFKPEVRLRRIEDLKRGTNKDIGPKGIFEMGAIKIPRKS
jgi:hypothetical protein